MLPNTKFKIEIPLQYGKLAPLISWCEINCRQGNWKYTVKEFGGRDAGLYEFYFEDEHDYVNFILWKT
jgi:hypothetical protein